MSPKRLTRQLGIAAVAGALLVPLAGPAQAVDYANTGHKFAAERYDWYPLKWVYRFASGSFPSADWHKEGVGVVGQNYGMITVDSDSPTGVSATMTKHAKKYGRWELRLRSKRFARATGADYTVETELVPAADPDGHCGGQSIDFGSYTPDKRPTAFALHSLPDHVYTASRGRPHQDDYWHTYGVEVTPKRISWFLDGKVQVTERNPEALSGVPYELRLALIPPKGARAMKETRLMVDTIRYFGLKNGKHDTTKKTPVARTAAAC